MASSASVFPEYNDNPNGTFILLLVGMAVPVVVVVLRFAARRIERIGWWWDDYLAVLSLLFFAGGFWADIQIARYQSNDQESFLLRVYINNILYPLIVSTTKISGLLLYLLHFGDGIWPRRITWALITNNIAWAITAVVLTVIQCQPIEGAWNAADANGAKCLNRPLLSEAVAIADSGLSLMILLFPLPKIFRLDLRSLGPIVSLLQVYLLAFLYVASLTFSLPAFPPLNTSETNHNLSTAPSPAPSSASTTPPNSSPSPASLPPPQPHSHPSSSGPNWKSPSAFQQSACQPSYQPSSRSSPAPSNPPSRAPGAKPTATSEDP